MYTKDLPASYQKTAVIDLKSDRKRFFVAQILGLVLLIPLYFLLLGLNALFPLMPEGIVFPVAADKALLSVVLAIAGVIVLFLLIMLLHELIRSLFFRHESNRQIPFSTALFGAYSGMPGYCFRKRTYVNAVLMPLALISAACLILLLFLRGNPFFIVYTVFALHLSACAGNLYYLLTLSKTPENAYLEDVGSAIRVYENKDTRTQE